LSASRIEKLFFAHFINALDKPKSSFAVPSGAAVFVT
jgi:hypothetical protein